MQRAKQLAMARLALQQGDLAATSQFLTACHDATGLEREVAATWLALAEQARVAAQRLLRETGESSVHLKTYGGFALTWQGQPLGEGWLTKGQVLFIRLLIQQGRPLIRQRLAEELWPDLEPQRAANNLRVTVHRLRKLLAPVTELRLCAEGSLLSLAGWQHVQWDAPTLEGQLATARGQAAEGNEAEVVRLLAPLLADTKGGFLPEPSFAPFFEVERRHYDLIYSEALTELATAYLQLGQPAKALGVAEAAIALDPLDEVGQTLVIRAHAALGYPQRSLASLRRYEQLLKTEGGGEPTVGARRLLQQLTLS